jgi:hypothetical protein
VVELVAEVLISVRGVVALSWSMRASARMALMMAGVVSVTVRTRV